MPRQQTAGYERICISNFLEWYNNKNHKQYRCVGHSKDIYASRLQGKKNWDWVCRDVRADNREMAVEVLSVTFEDPSRRRGAAYNVFLKTKARLDCCVPGSFFLRFPDALTAHQITKQEQEVVSDRLVSEIKQKLNELRDLPEWHYLDIKVENDIFKIQKVSNENCKLLDAFMATSFDANSEEIRDLLTRKIPVKNSQLEIPHRWGLITILLIQSSGVPHHTELIDIIRSLNTDQRDNIEKIFIVRIDTRNEVFEL
jgi:hypothetical protein